MSEAEKSGPMEPLTPEVSELVQAIRTVAYGDTRKRIMTIARHHGGYMRSFLRDIGTYPGVRTALQKAAPSETLNEQITVMYEAIDYIEKNNLYEL